MIDLIEKTVMTAIGAVALSQKKAEELLDELKQRFNVTEEEGKAFLDRLEQSAKDNQKKLEERAQEEVRKASERLGLVTKDEFEKLRKKVVQLEKKLKDSGN